MRVYIIQNEQDDICFVSSNPVETLEELERGGKQVISVTCWSVDEEKKFSLEDSRLKVHSTVDKVSRNIFVNGASYHSVDDFISNFKKKQ